MTNEEAKDKCCPYTLNIPQNKSSQKEYNCMGDHCMAWVYDNAWETELKKGYCRLIKGGK
jgi:hypothetical protein